MLAKSPRLFHQILIHPDMPLSATGLQRVQGLSNHPIIRAAPEELDTALLQAIDAMLVSWDVSVHASLLSRLINLRYIGLRATTLRNIDMEYAYARGITVSNISGYAERGTAEFVLASLFASCRRPDQALPVELGGKSLGVIGAGAVGTLLGQMAKAIGMDVAYYVPRPGAKPRPSLAPFIPLGQLMQSSDFISFHSPAGMVVATADDIKVVRAGTVIIVTTIGLPFQSCEMHAAACRGVRFVLDRCAAFGLEESELTGEGIIAMDVFAARSVESVRRAEDRVIANLSTYLQNTPVVPTIQLA